MEGAVFEVRIYFARKRSSQRRKEISPKKNFAEEKFRRRKISLNKIFAELKNLRNNELNSVKFVRGACSWIWVIERR